MKTIKIIDLLNKISKGEDVPRKIKYGETEYIANNRVYEDYKGDLLLPVIRYTYQLNSEVEIIEEIKLPEKLGYQDNADRTFYLNRKKYNSEPIKLLSKKINEIIDYLESKEKGE